VALSSSRLELQTVQRQLAIERRRLTANWGTASPRFTRAVGNLEGVSEPIPLEGLLERVEDNPDVARWLAEIEQRQADLALQRSLGTPDLTVVGGLRHLAETSDNAFILGLEIPLPISDSNQGGSRAAEYRLARALEEQRSALVAARADLAITHEGWLAAHIEVTTLDGEILPDAQLALETAQSAYQRGLFRLTDVLDTQRTLFQLRARRTDALERYHHAQADLERLIGDALTDDRRQ
jgi:cobalt-zinc-cadmium efflux system outer membrane protein